MSSSRFKEIPLTDAMGCGTDHVLRRTKAEELGVSVVQNG